MKADLYVRVSTDEQADKGYSQRDQAERLQRYCEVNKITVRRIIFEDHSAKNFNRPQWMDLLQDVKRKQSMVDFILFTKWDRVSRNAADAYQMINTLRKIGIEPQAIEQPLDLDVPMWLATKMNLQNMFLDYMSHSSPRAYFIKYKISWMEKSRFTEPPSVRMRFYN
jgi:DNA invertase Pin-like site-specific DNA recombinase